MPTFMALVPKRSGVTLKFERAGCRAADKVIVFARTVVGLEFLILDSARLCMLKYYSFRIEFSFAVTCLPGTMKPLRLFFVQLVVPDKEPVPSVGAIKAFKPGAAAIFPYMLKLAHAPSADLGGAGVWNQFEFAKIMLGISGAWAVSHLEVHQTTLVDFAVSGAVKEEKCASKASRAAAQEAEKKKKSEPDWAFFEAALLLDDPVAQQAGPGKNGAAQDGQSEAEESELSDFDDDGGLDTLSEPEGGQGDRAESAVLVKSNEGQSSAVQGGRDRKASDIAGRAAKTDATDFDLIRSSLHPRQDKPSR